MFEIIHNWELNFFSLLQTIRSPALDIFFRALDLFDRELFAVLALPIIWLGISRKWGIRFFYVLATSIFFNHFLKELFAQPRPFEIMNEVGVITRLGYGFPSGASQNSVIFLGMLSFMIGKKPLHWIISLGILLMGFSRIYLGVHFPSDVIVGFLVGASFLIPYCFTIGKIENWVETQTKRKLLILSLCLPLFFLTLDHSLVSLSIIFMIIGVSLGLCLTKKPFTPQSRKEKTILSIIGISGLGAIFLATKLCLKMTQTSEIQALLTICGYLLLGFWLAKGSSLCYEKCRRAPISEI